MTRICKTCFRLTQVFDQDLKSVDYCPYFKSPVDIEKDGCNKYAYPQQEYVCEVCGRPIMELTGTGFLDEVHLVCPNCFNAGYGCHTCVNGKNCGVTSDTSGRPQLVQKVIQQGNMQVITQGINPELEKEYCHHCVCWLKNDKVCFKNTYDGFYCENYTSIFRDDNQKNTEKTV